MDRTVASSLGWSRKEKFAAALPFLLLVIPMAWMGYTIVGNDPALVGPGEKLAFISLMVTHLALHMFAGRAAQEKERRGRWYPLAAYFVIQGLLLLALSFLTTYQEFIIALYTALAAEAAALQWPNLRAIGLVIVFYLALVALNFALVWDMALFVRSLPVILGTLAIALLYVVLYIRQVAARDEAQALLQDLEEAHSQLRTYADQVEAYASRVEELTISQERQRMARELHDTLAQGLAGLIMQLEAADSHLENHNPDRAQEIVQQATTRARSTLREARRAIQSLRASVLERDTLVDALGREVETFAATSGIQARFEVDDEPVNLAPEAAQNILRIVQAALSNIARHAQASNALIRLAREDGRLKVLIQDDGRGFDVEEAIGRQKCFGLAGMRERAERLGGELQVVSEPRQGTRMILHLDVNTEDTES